jgi:hypothetical protein
LQELRRRHAAQLCVPEEHAGLIHPICISCDRPIHLVVDKWVTQLADIYDDEFA